MRMAHEPIDRCNCTYTSCYCEENVWWLAKELRKQSDETVSNADVIFISNTDRSIPIWHQKAAKKPGAPVIWDYHVILALRLDEEHSIIYDLDTDLAFPCDFTTYSKESFKPEFLLKSQFCRNFRIVKAVDYLKYFASDRSHMKNEDGEWLAEPPSYLPICGEGGASNLQTLINMKQSSGDSWLGKVLTLDSLNQEYGYESEQSITSVSGR